VDQIFNGLAPQHWLVAVLIFAVFIGIAVIFRFWMMRVMHRMAKQTKTGLDDVVISGLGRPFFILIIVAGAFFSLRFLPWKANVGPYVSSSIALGFGLLGLYVVLGIVNSVLRWYGKQLAGKAQLGFTMRILEVFRIAAIITGVVLGVILGLSIFGFQDISVGGWLGEHGWRIGLIVAICLLAIVLAGQVLPKVVAAAIARRGGETPEEVGKRGDTVSRVLVNVTQAFVLFVAAFMILSELKIDIAPMLAGLGVVGVAVGFGAQSLVRDMFAGLFVILENQYRVGDIVTVAGVSGLVEDINLRRTILRDLDGAVHSVPNGEIRVASNLTKEWSRVNIEIRVSLNTDLEKAITVINRVGKELAEDAKWAPLIIRAPQVLRVSELAPTGVDIRILGDTKPMQQWDVTGELRRRLKNAFDREGIVIPPAK
jgi:small conductance mechanosensitive channel